MKIAFWFVGVTCAGKSYYALKLAEKLKTRLIHLDTIFDRIKNRNMTREESYYDLLKELPDTIILDGIVPFYQQSQYDRKYLFNKLKEYEIIMVLVQPDYSSWFLNTKRRKEEIDFSKPEEWSESEYLERLKEIMVRIEETAEHFPQFSGKFITIEKDEDLNQITEEELRNLRYQHKGFTDIKWKQLQVPSKNNSLLDLGCSSCQFEKYHLADGGSSYQGLDGNLSYLIRRNAERFNLNNLHLWRKPAEIVLCTSVLHYIHDKPAFIKRAAELTKNVFILEAPTYNEKEPKLHKTSRGLYIPTRPLLENWLSQTFNNFMVLGESIVEDKSFRLIYHCFPKK
jgi:adenylate kinase family enzyme